MYLTYRLGTWQLLAAVIFLVLGGFGLPVLHAQGQGCQQQGSLQQGSLQQKECPAPVVREKPTMPAETCCPVDPKEVHKAQKAAEHAQHEAAEACKRQQRAAEKAQRKVDEAQAKGNHEIEEANAKLEQRKSQYVEEQAKLDALTGSSQATAQAQTQPPEESEIMRTKPEPTPQPTPLPAPEAKPAPAPEVRPPAPPAPESTLEKPKELPKTASPMGLLSLIGLVSTAGSFLTGFFRP
jgi:cell division protein FtsN